MKLFISFAFLALSAAALAEPVPKEFLDPSLKPPVLDLSRGTEYDVILRTKFETNSYFLVEQRPRLGDWAYVVITQKEGERPKFVAAGSVADIFPHRNRDAARAAAGGASEQRPLPPSVIREMARAVVARELEPRPGVKPFSTESGSEFRKQLDAEWKDLPEAMQDAYKARGFR